MFTLDLFFDFTNFFFSYQRFNKMLQVLTKNTHAGNVITVLAERKACVKRAQIWGARYARSPVRIPSVLCAVVRAFTLEMRTPA